LKGALRLLTEMKKLPGGGGEKVGEGGGGAGREAESSIRVCRTILRGCLRFLIRKSISLFLLGPCRAHFAHQKITPNSSIDIAPCSPANSARIRKPLVKLHP
jgi:hypothetical protein